MVGDDDSLSFLDLGEKLLKTLLGLCSRKKNIHIHNLCTEKPVVVKLERQFPSVSRHLDVAPACARFRSKISLNIGRPFPVRFPHASVCDQLLPKKRPNDC